MDFREVIRTMLEVIRRRALVIGLPFWAGRAIASVTGALSFVTGGLIKAPVTSDQLLQLRHDNVVAEGARGFADLGIAPTAAEAVIPSYLWQFRPDGQYSDVTRGTRNLRH